MDELYYALVDLLEAQKERDEERERDREDGGSWNQHLERLEDCLEAARKRFKDGFKTAVREAMDEIRKELP